MDQIRSRTQQTYVAAMKTAAKVESYSGSARHFFSRLWGKTRQFLHPIFKKIILIIDRKPLLSFFSLLLFLFLIIVISHALSQPKNFTSVAKAPVKNVRIYAIGSAPVVRMQGQIEKSGIVTLNALSGGVVQQIYVSEGDSVAAGATVVALSSNYQGGNMLSLQRQLAERQYQNVKETYDIQKDLIAKQRDIAQKNSDNADQLRQINSQSINDTNSLIDLNTTILNSLDANLTNLQNTNINHTNDALILSTQQIKAQVLSGLNQARIALRSAQYSTDTDKPAAQLPGLSKELTMKQLDLQEKNLDLSKEVSRIQLQISRVSEATMYPSSPYSGVVQKVFVRPNQAVSPGTPLVEISSNGVRHGKLTVYVPRDIAQRVSQLDASTIYLGDKTISMTPTFVSTEAVQGTLYAIVYSLPDTNDADVTDKAFIQVDIPVGYPQTSASDPFIPIDALYQTDRTAYVYIIKDGKVVNREVSIGSIYGSYIQVNQGLSDKDQVILDRSVIVGDSVQAVSPETTVTMPTNSPKSVPAILEPISGANR